MPEENKPINFYDFYDFKPDQQVEYVNCHVVQHTPREIMIVLGCWNPPNPKAKVVTKLIMHPLHALELINNLKSQLDALKKETDDPPPPASKR